MEIKLRELIRRWGRGSALIVTLILASFVSTAARADERLLPAGSEIDVVDDPDSPGDETDHFMIEETHFLVERRSIDRANAAAEAAQRLERELATCTERVLEATQPPASGSGWVSAVKWTGIGVAVAGAFAAGVWMGSR